MVDAQDTNQPTREGDGNTHASSNTYAENKSGTNDDDDRSTSDSDTEDTVVQDSTYEGSTNNKRRIP